MVFSCPLHFKFFHIADMAFAHGVAVILGMVFRWKKRIFAYAQIICFLFKNHRVGVEPDLIERSLYYLAVAFQFDMNDREPICM